MALSITAMRRDKMENSKNELHIVLSIDTRHRKTVRIMENFLQRKVGREQTLIFSDQKIGLLESDLRKLFSFQKGIATWIIPAHRQGIEDAYSRLKAAVERGGSAMIPVRKSGKGPSEKSIKATVQGVIHSLRDREVCPHTYSHTLTLPATIVVEQDGQSYAPRWFLKRTIRERILKNKSWPEIMGGVWLDADMIWNDVFAPLEKEIEIMKREEEKEREKWRRMKENQEKERAERRTKIAQEAAKAKAEEKKREEEEQAKEDAALKKRMERLETVHAKRAEWIEWEKRKGSFHKKTASAENCIIMFSGKRAYIRLPDGKEIIKAKANVQWET